VTIGFRRSAAIRGWIAPPTSPPPLPTCALYAYAAPLCPHLRFSGMRLSARRYSATSPVSGPCAPPTLLRTDVRVCTTVDRPCQGQAALVVSAVLRCAVFVGVTGVYV
jgi:hypothetical protein